MLLIEEEADLLQDGLRVRGENGMLADADQRLVELGGVRQVEIPAQGKVAGGPGAPPEIGVAGAQVVAAAGPVAQVTEEELSTEVEILLHRLRELGMDDARGDHVVVLAEEILEDPVERVGLYVALAEHERIARGDVELHAGDTGAVLPAVVLLLHQEEELREPPERRPVLLLVVGKRLQEPHEGHSAFVGNKVAHRVSA